MKKLLLICCIFLFSAEIKSQLLHESNKQVGQKKIVPSPSLKEKILALVNSQTRFINQELTHINEDYFYATKNGTITYGPDVEYFHYRILFDKNENWLETQELFHCDIGEEDIYYQIMPKIKSQLPKKKKLDPCPFYYKITTEKGTWFEFISYSNKKRDKGTIYVFNQDIKLLKSTKANIIRADYSKIEND